METKSYGFSPVRDPFIKIYTDDWDASVTLVLGRESALLDPQEAQNMASMLVTAAAAMSEVKPRSEKVYAGSAD